MVDVFRLSGTTDGAIIDDRRQDMNGNREQILLSILFFETASGISKKLDRKQVLKVLSLKFVYFGRIHSWVYPKRVKYPQGHLQNRCMN